MPRYRTAYPPEFRRQIVELVRSGRMPEELAREFEPTAQSISTWVKQAERDAGERADGPGWSNGQTEGQICKLKLVKRQMYGSGKPDLLQVRVVGLT